jgi:AcrR family transcriptional regulator
MATQADRDDALDDADKPVTQARGRATRRRILDAAVELFQEKGFRATSLTDIAKAAEIRKATVYHHFPNKAMLLDEIFREVLVGMSDGLPPGATTPPCQRLGQVITNFAHYHLEHRKFMKIIWRERHELPEDSLTRVRDRELAYRAHVEQIIIDGQKSGCFRADLDTTLAVDSTLGMLTTVYRWPRPTSMTDDYAARVAEHTREVLLRGLSADCGHPLG